MEKMIGTQVQDRPTGAVGNPGKEQSQEAETKESAREHQMSAAATQVGMIATKAHSVFFACAVWHGVHLLPFLGIK
ncbi:hypothetical protein HY628_01165 [Candidatus Uhrbacteria bacterium]|nr:hypothetical protein [Candidatus Uhrbacteria bacterium]